MIQRLRQHWWPERGELDEPHGSGQTTHGAQESASWPLGPDEQHQWNRQDAHIMPQPPDRWQTQADRDDDHAASGSETAAQLNTVSRILGFYDEQHEQQPAARQDAIWLRHRLHQHHAGIDSTSEKAADQIQMGMAGPRDSEAAHIRVSSWVRTRRNISGPSPNVTTHRRHCSSTHPGVTAQ